MRGIDSGVASSVQTLRSTITAAALDSGAVLLDLESKYFYALNGSAWAIAQLFESGASIDMAKAQARAWGAPDDGHVDGFIAQLQRFGLLESSDPQPVAVPDVEWHGSWTTPSIERQAEPLQNVMVSAFDPSIPLAE
jgi:hypothetical protein